MIEFTMRVAGRVAAVSALFDSTRAYCADYLCEGPADFAVRITPQDIAFERSVKLHSDQQEGIASRPYPDAILEITAVQRKLAECLFAANTLLFHGSVVAVDGAAYLFTAKSGTGKSTHTRLWREVFGDRAVMVNDDKPFLRITPEGVLACGSPWNGKHRLGANVDVPLRAICVLTRGEVNEIQPLSAGDALSMLMQQSNRPLQPRLMPKYLELIDALTKQVAFYQLACNMDPQAARVAYEAMKG